MKRKLWSFLGLVLFASLLVTKGTESLYAESRVLDVETAVALAFENNISIKQSKMDLELLQKKKSSSWNSASPSLSLSGGYNGSVSGPFEDFSNNKTTSNGWSATGSVSIALSPALATSIKSAVLAYESGEMSLESTKRNIELNVRKTFYSLLYANENIQIQQRSLETAKQTYDSNLQKYNLGRLSELNLLNAQYNYESKIPVVANLQNTYMSNLDNFKVILGLDLSDDIELVGNLEDASTIELDEAILSYSLDDIPSVKTLKMSIESTKNALNATKFAAYGPSVSFSSNIGASQSEREMGGISVKADPSLSISYSVNLRIPLDGYLPWSNGALNVKTQQESLEKLNMNLENTKKSAEISIRNSYNAVLQAKKQLDLYEKNVELMQKTYDMTKKSYGVGAADLLSLQKAEDNLFSARYAVQNQRYTIISAVLDLENTLGLEFGSLKNNK